MNCDRLFGREALPKLSDGFGTVAFGCAGAFTMTSRMLKIA